MLKVNSKFNFKISNSLNLLKTFYYFKEKFINVLEKISRFIENTLNCVSL